MIQLILWGRPMTKKTHQNIVTNKTTGKHMLIPSAANKQYENDCLRQITGAYRKNIQHNVTVHAHYWMKDRVGWPDLTGLMQATGDILQNAGVIANDRLITSWGNTRIVGIDKDNPRVEIFIMPDPYEIHISTKGSGKKHV